MKGATIVAGMLRMVACEMLKKVIGKISRLMVVDFLGQWGDEMEGMCSMMFQLLLWKGCWQR